MTRDQLIEQFRATATEIAEKDFSQVQEDTRIAELGIDSLGLLELIGEFERALSIRVQDEELVGIETVAQLLTLMEGKLKTS
ncbi:MAG: acyl carrier protein [Polyangiales bacterium]